MYGMKVDMILGGAFGRTRQTFRNITEIHYRYGATPELEAMGNGKKIAFESNIHRTGFVYDVDDIMEFETTLETERANSV